jgi:hypothetical protein
LSIQSQFLFQLQTRDAIAFVFLFQPHPADLHPRLFKHSELKIMAAVTEVCLIVGIVGVQTVSI